MIRKVYPCVIVSGMQNIVRCEGWRRDVERDVGGHVLSVMHGRGWEGNLVGDHRSAVGLSLKFMQPKIGHEHVVECISEAIMDSAHASQRDVAAIILKETKIISAPKFAEAVEEANCFPRLAKVSI